MPNPITTSATSVPTTPFTSVLRPAADAALADVDAAGDELPAAKEPEVDIELLAVVTAAAPLAVAAVEELALEALAGVPVTVPT